MYNKKEAIKFLEYLIKGNENFSLRNVKSEVKSQMNEIIKSTYTDGLSGNDIIREIRKLSNDEDEYLYLLFVYIVITNIIEYEVIYKL